MLFDERIESNYARYILSFVIKANSWLIHGWIS